MVALLTVMAAAAVAIRAGDPKGPVVGLYLVTALSPLRLDLRAAVTLSLLATLAFDLHLILAAPDAPVFVAVVTGGAVFFFLMGVLLQREQTQRRRTDRLLAELEAARDGEREAVALAERARLAREMHDVLAHTLSGLALQLEGVRLLAGSRQADPEPTAAVERAGRLARGGLAEARRAIAALRGDALPGPELLPALVDQHRQAVGRHCRLEVRGQPRELPPDARLALYRTAQEALANVRKHAPGAAVDVRLTWGDDDAVLVVEDQAEGGAGALVDLDGGYGLTGMAERAELLGGHLDAGPTAGGFRVELRLPVEAAT